MLSIHRSVCNHHVWCDIPSNIQECTQLASWFGASVWEHPHCPVWQQGRHQGPKSQSQIHCVSQKEEPPGNEVLKRKNLVRMFSLIESKFYWSDYKILDISVSVKKNHHELASRAFPRSGDHFIQLMTDLGNSFRAWGWAFWSYDSHPNQGRKY